MHGPVGCHPATERSGKGSPTLSEAGGKEGRNGEGSGGERKLQCASPCSHFKIYWKKVTGDGEGTWKI